MNKAFEKILERLEEKKKFYDFFYKKGRSETDDIVKEATDVFYAEFVKIVREVAEAYNGGWILCSERLPEADENVLTCSEYGFITVSSCNNAGEFISYADEYCIKYPKPKVIAWQPLPEPYQPKGE